MCRSPDVDAKGLEFILGPLNSVRFRVFRVKQCSISVGSRALEEYVRAMPQFKLLPPT